MESCIEALEKMIISYERCEKEAAKEAVRNATEMECYGTFVLELRDLLLKLILDNSQL